MGDAALVRVAVHPPLEGPLQPGASLSGTLDFRAGREASAGGAAPRCSEVPPPPPHGMARLGEHEPSIGCHLCLFAGVYETGHPMGLKGGQHRCRYVCLMQ